MGGGWSRSRACYELQSSRSHALRALPVGVFVCKVFIADGLWVDLMSALREKVSGFKGLMDLDIAKS